MQISRAKNKNNFKSDKMVPATDGRLNTHKHFQPFWHSIKPTVRGFFQRGKITSIKKTKKKTLTIQVYKLESRS